MKINAAAKRTCRNSHKGAVRKLGHGRGWESCDIFQKPAFALSYSSPSCVATLKPTGLGSKNSS